jgi:hypothetical protein
MSAHKLQLDEALIIKMYEDGDPCSRIAEELGVATSTIWGRIRKILGSCRSRSAAAKYRPPISEETRQRKSDAGKRQAHSPHSIETLEKMRRASLENWQSEEYRNKVSAALTGELGPNWKGGHTISNGYNYIRSIGHPNANEDNYVQEHRLVVEEFLGRYLETHEVVHHIDGNGLNNCVENLFLFPSSGSHAGYHSKIRGISNRNNITKQEAMLLLHPSEYMKQRADTNPTQLCTIEVELPI